MAKPAVLYISYDGMLEPLGQSQVIAYLERLTDEVQFHLISFEKPIDWNDNGRRTAVADRLARAGIKWHPLRYHKRPTVPATMFDVAQGSSLALWLAVRHKVRLVHARSYIPGLMALMVKRLSGARFLFDIRGFWADERTDGRLWREGGWIYRSAKSLERALLLGADHIVTLTRRSVPVLKALPGVREKPNASISIITTCADLARFTPSGRQPPSVFTLGYIGSFGTWYMIDELFECFREIRRQRSDARMLIVNRHEHDLVRQKLDAFGIDPTYVELIAVEHADAPGAIRRMTVGSALIRPVFSKISSAPTKLAEYLGCGVPCLGNAGVGDMAEILENNGVGVALTEFSDAGRRAAIARLLTLVGAPGLSDRCRETALRLFSLPDGVARYRSIYRTLLEPDSASGRGN